MTDYRDTEITETMSNFIRGHILYEDDKHVFVSAYLIAIFFDMDVDGFALPNFYSGQNRYLLTIQFGWSEDFATVMYHKSVSAKNKKSSDEIYDLKEHIKTMFDLEEDKQCKKPCILVIDKNDMCNIVGVEQFRSWGKRKRIMFDKKNPFPIENNCEADEA